MYCSQCGKELPNGAKFCPRCGASADGAEFSASIETPIQERQNPPIGDNNSNESEIVLDAIAQVYGPISIFGAEGFGGKLHLWEDEVAFELSCQSLYRAMHILRFCLSPLKNIENWKHRLENIDNVSVRDGLLFVELTFFIRNGKTLTFKVGYKNETNRARAEFFRRALLGRKSRHPRSQNQETP